MPKTSRGRALRKLERVTLYAVNIGRGKLRLITRSGQRIGTAQRADFGKPSREVVSDLMWDLAIRRMLNRFSKQIAYAQSTAEKDPWDRKVDTWMTCLKGRYPARRASGRRFFSSDKRKTWDDAISCMRFQYKNMLARKRLMSDPWNLWAETVSRNHRRKAQVAYGKSARIARNHREAEVQVCWHWD